MKLPINSDAEEKVLATVLADENKLGDILDILPRPRMFAHKANSHIFRVMAELYEADIAIDRHSVCARLEDQKLFDPETLSRADILELEEIPGLKGENIRYWAERVKKAFIERETIVALQTGLRKFESGDFEDFKEDASRLIYEAGTVESPTPKLYDQVTEALQFDEDGMKEREQGLSWGLTDLDRYTGGIHRGKMVILAGLKKGGKSKFAIQMISNMLSQDRGVIFFSAEMLSHVVLNWLASYREKINSGLYGTARLTEDEFVRTTQCLSEIAGQNKLVVNDKSAPTLSLIRRELRRAVERQGVEAMVIDFIQRCNVEQAKGETRASALQRFSYRLADMARDFNVALLVLAQLSNEAEKAGQIHIGHVKESAGITEAADCILILDNKRRREHKISEDSKTKKSAIRLIIEAQRNGISGIAIDMTAKLQYGRFFEGTGERELFD